jgi:hypothetical protein
VRSCTDQRQAKIVGKKADRVEQYPLVGQHAQPQILRCPR